MEEPFETISTGTYLRDSSGVVTLVRESPPSWRKVPTPAQNQRRDPLRREVRPGRNQPCMCKSGKKHKHCCGRS